MIDRSIPFNRASSVGNEIQYIEQAIKSGKISGDGDFTKKCHAKIEEMTGSNCALLTHSCTAALEMAALLCDLQPGDEVIMPSFTFVSTANAVVLRGAIPVFVDIDKSTLNLSPDAVAKAVTERTKAIFAVHYAGIPADMDELADIARKHNILLVEDAAQAFLSTYKGRLAGSLGDLAAFSFHDTKNIISGEGGALTINRPELIERAEIIREKGTNRSRFVRGAVDKYTWVDVGSSYLPSEITAAFLLAQLENAKQVIDYRISVFNSYYKAFQEIANSGRVNLPVATNDKTGNGHIFYFLMRDQGDRASFISYMRDAGITTPFHYIPLHSSPAGLKYGRSSGVLQTTDDISARLVRLPLYYGMSDAFDSVVEAAKSYLEKN